MTLYFAKQDLKGRKCRDFRGIDPLEGVQCKFIEAKRCKMTAEIWSSETKTVSRMNAGVIL